MFMKYKRISTKDYLVNEDIISLQRIYQPKDAHSIAVRVFLLSL